MKRRKALRLRDLLEPGGWLDGLLGCCRALDPEWFERLQTRPAFKRLINEGVPEDKLLRVLAFVRLNSANKTQRVNAEKFAKAAAQLGVAACALECLPDLPTPSLNLIQMATFATAAKALGAMGSADNLRRWNDIQASIDRSGLSPLQAVSQTVFVWLLSPKHLANALYTLATYYDDYLAKQLKTTKPVRDSAKDLFLWLVPTLVEGLTGSPHDDEVATLYGLVFNVAPPKNLARLRGKLGPIPLKF